MKKIHEPIDFFTQNNSLLDTSILSYEVKVVSSEVEIVLKISSSRKESSWKRAELIFSNVQRLSFYWDISFHFYTIDRLKWIEGDTNYYISLDPYPDEIQGIHENDLDVILCKNIIAYIE